MFPLGSLSSLLLYDISILKQMIYAEESETKSLTKVVALIWEQMPKFSLHTPLGKTF